MAPILHTEFAQSQNGSRWSNAVKRIICFFLFCSPFYVSLDSRHTGYTKSPPLPRKTHTYPNAQISFLVPSTFLPNCYRIHASVRSTYYAKTQSFRNVRRLREILFVDVLMPVSRSPTGRHRRTFSRGTSLISPKNRQNR